MPLVKNVEELERLIGSLNIEVTSIDQLRELLLTVQQADSQDPAVRQEWAALRERQQALTEKAQEQDHAARMRALELGMPDQKLVETHASVLKVATLAAGLVGGLVTLGTLGCAVGATAVVVQVVQDNVWLSLSAIWAVAGLVSVVALLLCLHVVRRLKFEAVSGRGEAAPPATRSNEPVNLNRHIRELQP